MKKTALSDVWWNSRSDSFSTNIILLKQPAVCVPACKAANYWWLSWWRWDSVSHGVDVSHCADDRRRLRRPHYPSEKTATRSDRGKPERRRELICTLKLILLWHVVFIFCVRGWESERGVRGPSVSDHDCVHGLSLFQPLPPPLIGAAGWIESFLLLTECVCVCVWEVIAVSFRGPKCWFKGPWPLTPG